jgi:uncharacterized protein RhaS with RHS repeats
MAEDPIGLAGGDVSFYRYVQNDPVNWVDPWGLEPGGTGPWTITFETPSSSDRIKGKLETDWDRVKNPDRYGPSARVDTVMTYGGTAITTGALGAAGAGRTFGYWAPQVHNLMDITGGLMPFSTPEGYGMYAGIGMWVWDKGTQAWEWVSDQLDKKCK